MAVYPPARTISFARASSPARGRRKAMKRATTTTRPPIVQTDSAPVADRARRDGDIVRTDAGGRRFPDGRWRSRATPPPKASAAAVTTIPTHLQVVNRDRHDGGRVISIVSPGTNTPTFSSAMTARIAVYPYTCRRCSTYHAIAIIRGAAHRNEPEPATDPECLRSVRLESTFRNPFIIVEAR